MEESFRGIKTAIPLDVCCVTKNLLAFYVDRVFKDHQELNPQIMRKISSLANSFLYMQKTLQQCGGDKTDLAPALQAFPALVTCKKLCHCRQEATNATRIIHDNYDQVREGERTGNGEMGCSSLSGQPPPCSNSSIYSTVLMAGLPSSVSAECVGLTSLVNFLVSLSPHYASTVSFSHIRTMFRSEGKHTLFKIGLRQREASQVALVVKNLPANAG
uniref:Uncharacterized protein n=1 Tax=Capra hircus TaxID=9925 RepID=A0A8C2R6Q1_CAPHI